MRVSINEVMGTSIEDSVKKCKEFVKAGSVMPQPGTLPEDY